MVAKQPGMGFKANRYAGPIQHLMGRKKVNRCCGHLYMMSKRQGIGNNQCCVMCGPNDISRAGNMGLTDTVGSLHDEKQGMD